MPRNTLGTRGHREIAQDQKFCVSTYGNQVNYVKRISRKRLQMDSESSRRHFHSRTRYFNATLQAKSEEMRLRDLKLKDEILSVEKKGNFGRKMRFEQESYIYSFSK